MVHRIIFEELCRGLVVESSRAAFAGIMTRLSGRGAEAVVLGCASDVREPLFDATALHVEAALEFAIGAPAVR